MEDSNGFCLKLSEENGLKVATVSLPQYGVTEMTKLLNFQRNNVFCDACLVTELDNTKIFSHRNILSMASEYFHDMFKEDNDDGKQLAPLKEVSGTVLVKIVDFIYTGETQITVNDVVDILKWSQIYKLPKLTSACEKFLMLSLDLDNFLAYKKVAFSYECRALDIEVNNFIDKHFLDIANSDALHQMDIDQLMEVLPRSSIKCNSEEEVFAAVKCWVDHDTNERGKYLMELLPMVRFGLLTPKFVTDHANAFSCSHEALLYCLNALQWINLNGEDRERGKFCSRPRNAPPMDSSSELESCDFKPPLSIESKIKSDTQIPPQPVVWSYGGFFRYHNEHKCWQKIRNAIIETVFTMDDKRAIVHKKFYGATMFLVDLRDPSKPDHIIDNVVTRNYLNFTVCLVNDNIYFIGGQTNAGEASKEVFVHNIITGGISRDRPITDEIHGAKATFFNNCIYVVDGIKNITIKKFDVSTGFWMHVSNRPMMLTDHICIAHNDELYIMGEKFRNNMLTPVFMSCNLTTRAITDLKVPFSSVFTSACIVNDRLIAISEKGDPYQYIPDKNIWDQFKSFPRN